MEGRVRAVIQRVSRAEVRVGGAATGAIGRGLLVLLGVARDDGAPDARLLADKIAALRIFEDAAGKMNLAVAEVGGAVLVVSQFTLLGDARRGNRPGFSDAAPPEAANALYESVCGMLREKGLRVETGVFRAEMEVELVNDGPVTILLDSRRLF
ncbi:D-tyrosyl-tRNA(Tyr) deacylase [Anaeromyxobacter dehalogenans 2CP-1]|uniref:D-aminoacyl-tRNA deacylase n=1 Tax=Anaeromyxobacter dehalogenans (strain ATCC BAA-258 / DSM 21875 / 2CP-1) TaxID=455488 RepID=B8J8W1_ANAD2|nr:D-tyrosyl-tRNA(Tyr) deacylase [Anaeromyxobacter dehalogenans 2CP-1]